MTVYLLHFDTAYKHARHYIGFVDGGEEELQARLNRHREGRGARLLEVIVEAGIGFTLARTWEGGNRNLERRLKKWNGASKLCPICQKERSERNMNYVFVLNEEGNGHEVFAIEKGRRKPIGILQTKNISLTLPLNHYCMTHKVSPGKVKSKIVSISENRKERTYQLTH